MNKASATAIRTTRAIDELHLNTLNLYSNSYNYFVARTFIDGRYNLFTLFTVEYRAVARLITLRALN